MVFFGDILLANLNSNGLNASLEQVPQAMLIPAAGMFCGLLTAILLAIASQEAMSMRRNKLPAMQTTLSKPAI